MHNALASKSISELVKSNEKLRTAPPAHSMT